MNSQRDSSAGVDPLSKKAFLRAALPHEYSHMNLVQLFKSGMKRFLTNDGVDQAALVDAIGDFGVKAFLWEDDVLEPSELPSFSTPGELAVVASYATVRTKHFNGGEFRERIEKYGGVNIQPLQDIRSLYGKCYVQLLASQPQDFVDGVLVELAESLYRRNGSTGPTYTGPVVTGFETLEDGRRYVEIPIAASSIEMFRYTSDLQEEQTADIEFGNNSLYLPIVSLTEDWKDSLSRSFKSLVSAQEQQLGSDGFEFLLTNEGRIEQKLNSYDRGRLYSNFTVSSEKLQLIRIALEEADYSLDDGSWFSASDILDALEAYSTDDKYDRRYLNDLDSVQSIAQFLSENTDSYMLDVRRNNGMNEYSFVEFGTSFKQLNVTHPDDVFKLPCFAQMHQKLSSTGPSRKELFSFVRLTFWLESFYEEHPSDNEAGKILLEKARKALHETFARWEWYDETVTDEEIDYEYERGERREERRRRSGGETDGRHLPMGCDNPTMREYCIGKENCPYSIYGSLPFTPEMYERRNEYSGESDDAGF